jgi:hypothetical protein
LCTCARRLEHSQAWFAAEMPCVMRFTHGVVTRYPPIL